MKSGFYVLLSVFLLLTISSDGGSGELERSPDFAVKRPALPARTAIDRLRHGEILCEGGYEGRGVWAKMEGVIQAPPEVVWSLFIRSNDWKNYRIPSLADSRAVDEEIIAQVGSAQDVHDFYKVIGNRMIDPTRNRVKGGRWSNEAFQYYDIPWPLANRWMIVRSRYEETGSQGGRYRAEWTKAAGNVKTVDGTMTLEPFDGERTHSLMTYWAKSDPGSSVPKFLLKWGLKKTMPATMRAIRVQAEGVYGRATPLLKTQ